MPRQPADFTVPFVIGIDDTDNDESIGTGRLGRNLAAHLAEHRFPVCSVTRHQHLVHPEIPYTSHNSSCAIGLAAEPARLDDLEACCIAFLEAHFHPGADPGLCLLDAIGRPKAVAAAAAFGTATQERVMHKRQALDLAATFGIRLHELGGSGLGVVGALGAAGLRAAGNDGRLLDLPGLRDLAGRLTAGELLDALPLAGVFSTEGRPVALDTPIETEGWVRPVLHGSAARLVVYLRADGSWSTRP